MRIIKSTTKSFTYSPILGYTTEQAESLTNILVSVLSSQVEFQAKNLVSKQQQVMFFLW